MGRHEERFIGGHPLAGAETAGVENARADLFEGARWYLTPTERSSGVLYDRLQRAIADLGARPQAIDAETHDRLMATVSHLPHVIANVLVEQAAAAAAEESERLPEVGPSFRDTTRVAGANPPIWGDIFATNREAVAREVEAVSERLREAAELIRSGDAERVAPGTARPASIAAACWRPIWSAASSTSCGWRREPAGDRRRARPGARPRRRQHRGHGALPGARHAHRRGLAVGRRRGRGRARGRDRAGAGPQRVRQAVTRFAPSGPLRGALRPPPDKSISHRAALIGAMGEGATVIEGYLDAADTRATLNAVRALGAELEELGPSSAAGGSDLRVRGSGCAARGSDSRQAPRRSRSRWRTPAPCFASCPAGWRGRAAGAWTLDGDESIRRRPVDRVAEPLRLMGAKVECRDGRLPPLRVEGSALRGVAYELPVASAQVKSCVLIAGLLAEGETQVVEPAATRDHTERHAGAAGAEVEVTELRAMAAQHSGPRSADLRAPAERLELERIAVPGDFSSAAFLLVAAALVPGSSVRLERVGLNPTRVGLLGVLNRMGAAVEVEEDLTRGGPEPQGAIVARHGPLAATRVHGDEVPLAIDELPLVALAGCFAEGRTVVSGAGELRHKESDRIAAVVEGLRGIGAEIEALEDGFAVRGTGGLRGGTLDARGDHRMAMLGAIAGLASRDGVEVVGVEAAAVSYPGFEADLRSLLV